MMPNKIKVYRPKGLAAPPEQRESAAVRGYDVRWQRLRMDAMREWIATHGPYCGDCKRPLDFGRGTHCDHVVPHKGQSDPMFWSMTNLQFLCAGCHATKTRREAGRAGGYTEVQPQSARPSANRDMNYPENRQGG